MAGREPERALIQGKFEWLQSNSAPGSDVIIYGPRGNGKTALIEWALREAQSRGIGTMDFSPEEIEAGEILLHAVQRLGCKGFPIMLLVVGTPDLPRHLNSMEASYWDRSQVLPLGLLAPEAAADAIRIPMEAGGRSISADALAQVVAESHGYPYFVQLWGRLLWTEMADQPRPVSLEDVDRIKPRFEGTRNNYCRNRYGELKRAQLELVAAKLYPTFIARDRRTDLEVDEAIRLALESEGRLRPELQS